jgi:hypothetical protein
MFEMDDDPTGKSRRWRPRIRLTMRVLAALLLVPGAGLGKIAQRAHIWCEAVAAVQRVGGMARYHQSFAGPVVANVPGQSGWKKWLVGHLGIDYFENADAIQDSPLQESSERSSYDQ